MLGTLTLMRLTIAPQWNHVRAVFLPHATVLKRVDTTAMLRSSVSLQVDRIH
jgi:hypothetical protein